MTRQGIFTGSSPNDGTGDSLVVGAVKVNQNFSEIYTTFGDGNNLVSYVNNAGVATVAQGLSGTPNLNVGVVTATFFYGDGSNLTGVGGLGTESDPIFTSSVAFGISATNISNWNTAYSWGNHASVGYVTSLTLNQLVDVNAGGPSTGQVLKWSGSEWQAASDLTAAGGSGIGLTDLSVTIEPAGINSLTYNNTTGIFEFTPAISFDQDLNTTNDVTFNRLGLTAGEINVGVGSDLLINVQGEGSSTYTFGVGGILNIPGNLEIGSAGEYVLFNNTGSHIQADQNYDFRIHVGGFANKVWAFSTDGSTTLPNGTQIVDIGNPTGELPTSGLTLGNNRFQVSFGSTINDWALFSGANLIQFESDNNLNLIAGNSVNITGGGIEGQSWQFNSNGTITFPDSTVQTTAYTGAVVGSAGTWAVNAAGIHTTKNVGINTTLSSSALTVEGDGRFSGIVTATRFESTSSGTPTIDSPNNLNINAINVAISTDVSVGRSLSVTGNTLLAGITTVGLANTSTPPSNSQLSFELTSNTNLRIKVRGSDGVLRSADITLA